MNFTKDDIIAALKMVFDPEIPVNVWDLGLIYDIEIEETRDKRQDISGLSRGRKTFKIKNEIQTNTESSCLLSLVSCFSVKVRMTLTSPTCPMAEEIVQMVRQAVESVAGKGNVSVELVWDPPWTLDKMSAEARLELDLTEEGW